MTVELPAEANVTRIRFRICLLGMQIILMSLLFLYLVLRADIWKVRTFWSSAAQATGRHAF